MPGSPASRIRSYSSLRGLGVVAQRLQLPGRLAPRALQGRARVAKSTRRPAPAGSRCPPSRGPTARAARPARAAHPAPPRRRRRAPGSPRPVPPRTSAASHPVVRPAQRGGVNRHAGVSGKRHLTDRHKQPAVGSVVVGEHAGRSGAAPRARRTGRESGPGRRHQGRRRRSRCRPARGWTRPAAPGRSTRSMSTRTVAPASVRNCGVTSRAHHRRARRPRQ